MMMMMIMIMIMMLDIDHESYLFGQKRQSRGRPAKFKSFEPRRDIAPKSLKLLIFFQRLESRRARALKAGLLRAKLIALKGRRTAD